MLKIKESVDLKELKKYGFEVFNNNTARKIYYQNIPPICLENDTYFMIEHREIWFIENGAKEIILLGQNVNNYGTRLKKLEVRKSTPNGK